MQDIPDSFNLILWNSDLNTFGICIKGVRTFLITLPLEYPPLRIETLLLQPSKLIIEGIKLGTQGCNDSQARH